MLRQRIPTTGTDPVIAQPHNEQGSFDEDFLDYVPEELMELPNNSFYCLYYVVAATKASMRFSAFLSKGGSAIPSITNMTRIENTGLIDPSTIVYRVVLHGG
jgi:hypothetical protein